MGRVRSEAKAVAGRKWLPVLPGGGVRWGAGGGRVSFHGFHSVPVFVPVFRHSYRVALRLPLSIPAAERPRPALAFDRRTPWPAVSARRCQLTAAGLCLCFSPFGPGSLLWLIAHQLPLRG